MDCGRSPPFAAVAFIAIVAAAYYLSSVSLDVTTRRITIGQGRWEREPRTIPAADIADASGADLSWLQCLGIGLPARLRAEAGTSTRLSVRPGPTLCLALRDGETIRVSTPDPAAALRVLRPTDPPSGTSPAGH